MRIPILKLGGYLIVTVQPAATDTDFLRLRGDLLGMVGAARARGVVIDVTSLDVLDSYASRSLKSLAQMVKLRGADTVIVGIQPEVAFAMVQLGLTLPGIPTALDLEEGMLLLRERERLHRRQRKGPAHGV
jgi:rsbT antagonist protein RsbS